MRPLVLLSLAAVFPFAAFAQTCTFTLQPSSMSFGASGGIGTITVTASSQTCVRTPAANVNWITFQVGNTGTGNGTVGYTVAANPTTDARTGNITIGNAVFIVSQAGAASPACTFTLVPASNDSVPASGGTGTFRVIASSQTCDRDATPSASWISIPVGRTGTGNGTVGYSIAANNSPSPRSGTITVGNQAFIIKQSAALCDYAFSPQGASFPASGGVSTFNVLTTCTWTANSDASWITLNPPASGNGNGSVQFTVAPNTASGSRMGTIRVLNEVFTVTQQGVACAYTLSPTSGSAAATGQSGSFNVTTASTCTWTAATTFSWITVTPGSGQGNGTVQYTAAANPSAQARNGTISVGGQLFTLSQAGSNCTYTLTPASAVVTSAAATGSFNVSGTCPYTAASTATWISITSGATGGGSGVVQYAVGENTSPDARIGSITIGSQTFNITQSGGGCSYTLTPRSSVAPATGGVATISVAARAGCTFTATSNTSWLSIGAVTGTQVTYSAAANTTGSDRTGTLTIGGQTFTVVQPAVGTRTLISGLTNAASFNAAAIAPGEIVTLFGFGLGPSTLVTLQLSDDGQFVTTTLADTRVLFDGVPAPLIYVSDTQVSVVVPYSVAGKARTAVQAEYRGTLSSAMMLDVAPAAPGIFTLDESGAGPGAILNQDASVNTVTKPAGRGSIVSIFATGEGQTRPAGTDGKLTGDLLPRPERQVTARIGGIDAEVLYAGGAPGLVSGVLQVNARIPDGVTPGAATVEIAVGGVRSQAGVTVAVE